MPVLYTEHTASCPSVAAGLRPPNGRILPRRVWEWCDYSTKPGLVKIVLFLKIRLGLIVGCVEKVSPLWAVPTSVMPAAICSESSAETHYLPLSLLSVNDTGWDSLLRVFGLSLLSFRYMNALLSVVILASSNWRLQARTCLAVAVPNRVDLKSPTKLKSPCLWRLLTWICCSDIVASMSWILSSQVQRVLLS